MACKGTKSETEKAAEVAQQAAEGWEQRLTKLKQDAADKFPDAKVPATATPEERRVAQAKVEVQRAQWIADWVDPWPKPTLNLADLHVGDKGKANAVVRVVSVHDFSIVVSYRGSRFAVGGVETANHATGHQVRLDGYYEATRTSDYGDATLVKIHAWKPDPKDTWRHEQALGLLAKAKKEAEEASAAIPSPKTTANAAKAKSIPKSETEPKPADSTEGPVKEVDRKAVYAHLVAGVARVEADAVKKFGRKPKADDLAGFTVPYKIFVDRETDKVYQALEREKGIKRPDAEAILKEGNSKGWSKK